MSGPHDVRLACEVGRRARAELTFAVCDRRTVLAQAYAEPPFRVAPGFVEGDGLHVILTSSAPGIFGGDALTQTVTVARGARVRLSSQSAMQVHPSREDAVATFACRYLVESGSHLSCGWDAAIPFPGARFEERIQIDLDPGATLVWSDAVMSGRAARGERWQFLALAHELRLTRGGSLVYLERYRIDPGEGGLERRWVASDACYFGTVLMVGPEATRATAERLHHGLAERRDVRASADLLEGEVLLVRLTAASGPAFHEARQFCGWGAPLPDPRFPI